MQIRVNLKKARQDFEKTLELCHGMVDYQGWRYSQNVGLDPYDPFDIEETNTIREFWIAVTFLKRNFSKPSKTGTVSSYDLKHAIENWWSKEYPNKGPLYISNGMMLVAIVHAGFAPEELWYSMDLSQNARIQMKKWNAFCEKYEFTPHNPVNKE